MKARIIRLYRQLVWAAKDVARLEAALDGLAPIIRDFKPTLFEVRAREGIHEDLIALRESIASALDTANADHAELEERLGRALKRHGPATIKGMRLTGIVDPDGAYLVGVQPAEGVEVITR